MGDQIKAIDFLVSNIDKGVKEQVLLGATGTGKSVGINTIINSL